MPIVLLFLFFWDDNDNVVNNVYIKSWHYFSKYFSENLIAGAGLVSNYWRPLLLVSYSLDYHFFGLNIYWWHFVNVSLHIACAFLIFLILKLLVKKSWFAYLISFIFLVHPIQTEAVTMITARADPMFFLFFLISIWCYLKKKYWISLFAFGASLLVKEIAIVLPAILILIEICFPRKDELLRKKFFRVLPFVLLGLFYFFGRLTILNFDNTLNFYDEASTLYSGSVLVRFLSFLKALGIYYSLLIFPYDLHMERLFVPATTINFSLLVIFLTTLFFFVFSLYRFKKNKFYFFGFCWFFISIAPVSGVFIPINRVIYEHWLYIPMIGFFIFFIALFFEMFACVTKKFPRLREFKKILAVFVVFYILILCAAVVDRNKDWKNPITFFNNVLNHNAESFLSWNNLGMAYYDIEDFESAKRSYQNAIKLDLEEKSAVPYHNLGNLYRELGFLEEAEIKYKKAININQRFYFSYDQLISLYIEQKRYAELKELLKTKLEFFPNDNLAITLLKKF